MRTVADVRAALENYDDDDEFHIVLSEQVTSTRVVTS
jgi:hypothetical protein